VAAEIVAAIKPLGFRFVALDLEGYRISGQWPCGGRRRPSGQ
jgi:PP-loop superfamily ATP-utilizing enzyme